MEAFAANTIIGFDFPVEKSKLFDRLNAFVMAQNLFTWTDYSGYNPEISSFSYDGLQMGWTGTDHQMLKTFLWVSILIF